ncbi:hypothetical protein OPV22_015987 [Ensete ventricosum]|uniref:Uncharacterized protein n=1 Tax=Ensete ventricosum TaxID=4639 RepID=A0AAV8RFE6_ENSVE|nr:hypothetical protein OPV22_015987 [Ensete ventricosum]
MQKLIVDPWTRSRLITIRMELVGHRCRTTESEASEASEASRSDHTKRGGGGDAPLFGERRLPTMECATSPVVVFFFFFFSRLLFLRHDVFCATLLLESAYRPTLESQSNNTVCLLLQDANGHHSFGALPFFFFASLINPR